MPDGGYPGDDAVTDVADDRCYARSEEYAMDAWALPVDVDIYYFTPTRQSWRYGDREITCMFGNVDAEGSLTGSLRRDATTLDDDQLAFLEADAILNDAFDQVPDTEYVEDDLSGHKVWASQVVRALEQQTSALRAHDWESSAEQAVTDYVEALDEAREEWEAASEASDAEDFTEHWDKAYRLTGGPKAVTAREALGLATESPTYDDEDAAWGRWRGRLRRGGVTASIVGRKCLRKALAGHMSSHRVILWPLLAWPNPRLPRCCCLYILMGAASDFR